MHVLVTCKYKKDRKNNNRKKGGDIIFPIISQWGLSVAMETRVFIQSAPKPYIAFPHPNDAAHKIWSRLANWLQRYSSSKVWNFRHSRASNSKMSGLIRPKIKLDRAFMPVLLMMIRSKMNELAWRHHFPIISLWEFFRSSRAANSIVSGPIWPQFELVRDFMHVLVTCEY